MIVAALGDVVHSRRYRDQVALLRALDGVLRRVNDEVAAIEPLHLTVRDEFQGSFPSIAVAVEAALRLRLAAGEVVLTTDDDVEEPLDVRLGLGTGHELRGDDLVGQSGSAWWLARDALDAAFSLPSKTHWPPSIRVVHRSDDMAEQGAINAFLLCQDQLFARMDARDRRALRGLLDGERQIDVATELGITQPAIARRLRDRGALAIKRGLESLRAADVDPDPEPGPVSSLLATPSHTASHPFQRPPAATPTAQLRTRNRHG